MAQLHTTLASQEAYSSEPVWLQQQRHGDLEEVRVWKRKCEGKCEGKCEYKCECKCECKYESKCECKCEIKCESKCNCESRCKCKCTCKCVYECECECQCECVCECVCECKCKCKCKCECEFMLVLSGAVYYYTCTCTGALPGAARRRRCRLARALQAPRGATAA